jgi:hypothetical protein
MVADPGPDDVDPKYEIVQTDHGKCRTAFVPPLLAFYNNTSGVITLSTDLVQVYVLALHSSLSWS